MSFTWDKYGFTIHLFRREKRGERWGVTVKMSIAYCKVKLGQVKM